MEVNNNRLHEIYHDVEFLRQHLSDLIYTMNNTLDDVREIKDRLDDMILEAKEDNDGKFE